MSEASMSPAPMSPTPVSLVTMSEAPTPPLPESSDNPSPKSERAWSFMAVAAVIVVGLSLMLGVAVLLSRLLGNPPA